MFFKFLFVFNNYLKYIYIYILKFLKILFFDNEFYDKGVVKFILINKI